MSAKKRVFELQWRETARRCCKDCFEFEEGPAEMGFGGQAGLQVRCSMSLSEDKLRERCCNDDCDCGWRRI